MYLAHALLAVVAVGAAIARDRSPIGLPVGEVWLPLPDALGGLVGHASSLLGGFLKRQAIPSHEQPQDADARCVGAR